MDARRHLMRAVAFRYRATDFKPVARVVKTLYYALPSSTRDSIIREPATFPMLSHLGES